MTHRTIKRERKLSDPVDLYDAMRHALIKFHGDETALRMVVEYTLAQVIADAPIIFGEVCA